MVLKERVKDKFFFQLFWVASYRHVLSPLKFCRLALLFFYFLLLPLLNRLMKFGSTP